MRKSRFGPGHPGVLLFWACLVFFAGCVSHLEEAKSHFASGEEYYRAYQTEKAVASFKRALSEAELETRKRPSAQAYMLKGLAELNLQKWETAKESFLKAHSFGFEKGEEWAAQLTLFGLASTLHEMGLRKNAAGVYKSILDKSKFDPVTRLAAEKYVELTLEKVLTSAGAGRKKMLQNLLKTMEKLIAKNYGCGFYHYLKSQVLAHLLQYRESFEAAVIARELGLPSRQISRDNDNQVVFCYRKLGETLSSREWQDFESLYRAWLKRWGWTDPGSPAWKKR